MTINFSDIALELNNYSKPLDLSKIFPDDHPVEIEIGAGKGTFLLNQARINPDRNYLGIEWANKYYKYTVDRLRRWQVTNARVLRADAREFLRDYLADESVQVFHIYYPDPWPKKRHHKRRFFLHDNMLQLIRCLRMGGRVSVATDHGQYFQAIREILLEDANISPCFEQTEFYRPQFAGEGEWVGSNFERKYLKEGRDSHKIALLKVKNAGKKVENTVASQ